MSDAYVLETVRTPRGKAKSGGGLNAFTAIELLEMLYRALEERTSLKPAAIDDVIIGCASQIGEQGGNIARTSALTVGWGDEVPGVTLNRFCASGLDAVATSAARVRAGDGSLFVAGGVESVSRVPMYSDGAPLWSDPGVVQAVGSIHMGVAADLVATLDGFGREELDAYGLQTQQRASAAWSAGRFARSLVPAVDADGRVHLDRDEHVRSTTTLEQLAAMQPAFAGTDDDGIALRRYPQLAEIAHLHTRGTSPSLADAAGIALIGSLQAAESLGLEPRARIVSTAARSVDPVTMLTAGQLAVQDAVERAGLTVNDIDLFEFAEAFAALCLKFQRDLDVSPDRFNVNGGTIAMGHAFGATGAILLATLVDEMERRDVRYGVVGISGAAGLGVAVVVERPPAVI